MLFAVVAAMMAPAAMGGETARATRVCSKYSTILLAEGEQADVDGAGAFSLSLHIKGPKGNWIFFDSMAAPLNTDRDGALVMKTARMVAYRQNHDKRIYAVLPTRAATVDGKAVKTAVMGIDFMRAPLVNPAIVGDSSDLPVIKRVLPGELGRCDLRFVAGRGLVRADSK